MILLNADLAAPVAAEVLTRPDGEEKAADGDGGSHPEGPESSAPDRPVKPGQRDPGCREEDDRDEDGQDAQDARDGRFEAVGVLGIGGLDPPVD